MKMDVFGLDREKIMHKVKYRMLKTGKNVKVAPLIASEETETSAIHFSASKNFERYLIDKRKMQLKREKERKNELNTLKDVQCEEHVDDSGFYEDINVENDDYVETDNFKHK